MKNTKKYIGITIGPIFDMMSLVSTPAALWATSYMFSMVSKEACIALKDKGYKIISPFFDSADNELFNKNDGIGLFHDRIIIEAEEKDLEVIKTIKNDVLNRVGKAFEVGNELEKRVLFIATVINTENGENPILKGGKILDSLELSRKIMFSETSNPILENFTGTLPEDKEKENHAKSKNDEIKNIAKKNLGIKPQNWSLLDASGNIRSLEKIALAVADSKMKKHSYYAIVRSDGDNMSKIISMLQVEDKTDSSGKTELTLSKFSKTCLEYCAEVANIVKKYKGVPIYSSGDDLLAIMPCDSGDAGTIFNFVKEVNTVFAEKFSEFIEALKGGEHQPSISFGISICYKRFPLYEALADSANLLFDVAKNIAGKSCTAVRLQKHSGQSEGLVIYNDALDDFLEIHNSALGLNETATDKQDAEKAPENNGKTEKTNDILFSALYKTEQFECLFDNADGVQIGHLFNNTFDAPEHKNNSFVHEKLPAFYNVIKSNKRIKALSEEGIETQKTEIKAFNFALRMLKFFVEKAGKGGN